MTTRPIQAFGAFFLIASSLGAQQNVNKPVLSPAPVQAAPLPPTAPLAGQPSEAPAQVSANYVIGPDDGLQITVWKETTISGAYPVRPDGVISIPLLGDVKAAGLTPVGLGDYITERLKKYMQDPLVTVSVTAVNSKRIYLIGQVGRVGPMPLTAALSPMQAIASAGGLTTFANSKHIYILRNENGKEVKLPFNYKKAVKDGDSQGITLLPGDTIVVP